MSTCTDMPCCKYNSWYISPTIILDSNLCNLIFLQVLLCKRVKTIEYVIGSKISTTIIIKQFIKGIRQHR